MKLKLLLTFDHELPLGGIRSFYQEAMFDPTDRLFDMARQLQVPIVLFTDVLCGIRFKEWDNTSFYQPYIKQLQEAISKNHDVQLHLHPHWLTSSFRNNTFVPSNDYRLADFKSNEEFPIEQIIRSGIDFLREVCTIVKEDYKCVAFRAGGYNIEKETKEIITALYKYGIRFDSSIAKGYYFSSSLSEVNYLNMPKPPNWYLGLDGSLRADEKKGLLEIPIATIPKTPFEMPTRFKLKKLEKRAPKDNGFQIHDGKTANIVSKIKMMFSARMLSFDNYTLSANYLMRILEYNVRKYRHYDTVILAVTGHPKTMGDYSFYLLESFVNSVRKKYPETEFTTFFKLASEMKMD
jgi:hypothetical protein